jgi:exo-1,4-beta-D-glucosaminidase
VLTGPGVGRLEGAEQRERQTVRAANFHVGDNELQSSIWNDNDITLWPGESETLTSTYNSGDLQGASPVISVSGWNMPKIDVAAPVP